MDVALQELFFSVMQQRISYQEENTKQKVSSDGSESEYDSSDYEAYESCSNKDDSDDIGYGEDYDCEDDSKSEKDSELDYKPWRANPALYRLDSTLRESATWETEGAGPFFWVAISDVGRHREKDHCAAGYESMMKVRRRFGLNKMWKYWLCYSYDEIFTDRQSHMVHLEDKHQLCIARWLIPKQNSRDAVEDLRQDVVKREPASEDSITLDHTSVIFSWILQCSIKCRQPMKRRNFVRQSTKNIWRLFMIFILNSVT